MKRKIRWRHLFRFFLPLLFVGVALEILFFAPGRIGTQLEGAEKSELSKPVELSNEAEQMMEDVHLVEVKGGRKDWELWAKKAISFRDTGQLSLEEVKVKLFGKDDVFYIVTGKKGEVDKKDIVISGDVITETSNGYKMYIDPVKYISDKRVLESPSDVRVVGPFQKNEGPIVLTGEGMLTDLEKNEIQILANVRSEKKLNNGSHFKLESDKSRFLATNYSAFFEGNVAMDYNGSKVTGETAELTVDQNTKQAQSATVFGKVRLTDIQRWAVAQEAKMIFPEKKFILRGSPRVVQEQDEITGEEIVFLNNGNSIQVKKARAKFDKNDSGKN